MLKGKIEPKKSNVWFENYILNIEHDPTFIHPSGIKKKKPVDGRIRPLVTLVISAVYSMFKVSEIIMWKINMNN
jgi:hypothetical protein